jgi:hypothetical protein
MGLGQKHIREFSGNHVTLPNSLHGHIYDVPNTYWWVSDDLTLNINSIYSGEKLWIQRVDWEWMSKEVLYEDESYGQDHFLHRSQEAVEQLYAAKSFTHNFVKDFLIDKINSDDYFAKRCLLLLQQDRLMHEDLPKLFADMGIQG